MSDQQLIAVTGATGAIGGLVAAQLSARGLRQRLVVRDSARAPALSRAETVVAAYGDSPGLRTALDGVTTLFLVSASESADRVAQHTSTIDAAIDAGVQRVVYLSFLAAAPDATFTFARDHWATEEHIKSTDLAYTFLRDSLYLDFVPSLADASGVIRGPAGDGRVAPVARDDVAAVAIAVLTQAGHDGRTYDVTGPHTITLDDAAAQLAGVSGRPVRYQRETLDEADASRAGYGAPDWEVEGWVTSYAAIATGEMDVVSDSVFTLTGRTPIDLAGFLEANPESYVHLVE